MCLRLRSMQKGLFPKKDTVGPRRSPGFPEDGPKVWRLGAVGGFAGQAWAVQVSQCCPSRKLCSCPLSGTVVPALLPVQF